MKKLTIFLFSDDAEFEKSSDSVFERFFEKSEEKEFCGIWGEIQFNNKECLAAIATTVNYFISETAKTDISFGCCKKDYDDILSLLCTENCIIETVIAANI